MFEIRFHNCTLQYQGAEVLSNFSFKVEQGKHSVIHGPIGCGKTMLLKSLTGNVQLKSGRIEFFSDGREISKFDFHKKVSLVEFANPSKFFNPKNHFYQQRYHHQMEDDEWSKSITIRALLNFKGFSEDDLQVRAFLKREKLFGLLDNKLIHLSSGQRRELQLVLSLLHLPEIILLDSPYIGLDAKSRDDLNEWLHELVKQKDLQIIMTANDEDAPAWIDNRIAMPSGYNTSIFHESHQAQILLDLQHNHDIQGDRNPVLELQNIKINFGKTTLFEGINWSVLQGEHVALIGENGSGKSTLLSLIYADNPRAYSNHVKMFGIQRGKGDSIWSVKKRIGFVSSELHLYFTEKYSCAKVIATGFFDSKFVPRKITEKESSIIKKYASYFDISHLLDREYVQTSLGEQKLVLFIRALVKNPELLLLDEPYQAFNSKLIKKANALLDAITEQSNTTLIFISHYRNEIPDCVERIYELTDGKLQIESA